MESLPSGILSLISLSESIFSAVPHIIVNVEGALMSSEIPQSFVSIPLPLPPPENPELIESILEQIFSEGKSGAFYPFPEQGERREMFPSFYLRFTKEQIPQKNLLVFHYFVVHFQMYLEKYKLPYEKVTIAKTSETKVQMLLQLLQSCVMSEGKPYLFGEDQHCYGTILDIHDEDFTVVFFPPDLPLALSFVETKNSEEILRWIQTVPLEYVHFYFSWLQK